MGGRPRRFGVTDIAAGDLHGSDLQRFLVNSDVYLAPDAPLGATMLSGTPLTFALGLDTGAVDQKFQRAFPSTVGDGHVQLSLATAQGAEVRDRPVQLDQPKQAFDETSRLSQRHTEQHLHRQARLDRRIAEAQLPTTFSGQRWFPHHIGIKPHCQRTAPPQRFIVSRPIRGLVLRRGPTAHASQLSCWIHAVNPSNDLYNKAT